MGFQRTSKGRSKGINSAGKYRVTARLAEHRAELVSARFFAPGIPAQREQRALPASRKASLLVKNVLNFLTLLTLLSLLTIMLTTGAQAQTITHAEDPIAEAIANERANPRRTIIKTPPKGTRVNVSADHITYNSQTKIAVATGKVVITYGQYVLVATKVVYDRINDRLRADGNVRLREPGGNILEANVAQLENKFRDGFAEHLRLLLTNDAVITADYAKRRDGYLTVYDRVTYTRCNHCTTPKGAPLWQLKSRKVTHNEKEGVIYHEDTTMEFAGLPIFWLPSFSHPDPTVKRRTGFLIPRFLYSQEFGAGIETPYFINLAPNYDLTLRPVVTHRQGPLMRAVWRHRLRNGSYYIDAGGAYQLNPDRVAPPGDVRLRGFARTEGEFRISDHWIWGWDITGTSDDTFMRRYKIDSRTDLENVVHITGLKDRNYFTARAYHFKGLLTTDIEKTYPIMAPYIEHDYTFDEAFLGGELNLYTNVYSLHRKLASSPFPSVNHGKDQTRITLAGNWKRRIETNPGLIITPFAQLRGDLYLTDGVPDASVPGGFRNDETEARILPRAGVDLRWPFVRHDEIGQHVFTPVVQVVTATNTNNNGKFGVEDSVTLNFDHSSLFLQDRNTGLDRYETGSRLNYGLLYSIFFQNGGFLRASIGESYHFAGRNSFLPRSGLEDDFSDIVTAIAFQPFDNLKLTYQGRFDKDDFELRSLEAGIQFELFDHLTTAINYAIIDAEPGYGRITKQEQVWATANLDLGNGWHIFGGARYDLEENRHIRNLIGLGFDCECFNFKVFYTEDYTHDGDVETDRSIQFSIEFKTLGSSSFSSKL